LVLELGNQIGSVDELSTRNFRSENLAKILNDNAANFADFSEWSLISKAIWVVFDSAIPRFESWRPAPHHFTSRRLQYLAPLSIKFIAARKQRKCDTA
jgi:hypothetical protein